MKRFFSILAAALMPVSGATPAFSGPEDLRQWSHSTTLGFDTSPRGADVAGAVTGFPVLIRLDETNFSFAQARRDGADLRFSDPDGSALPHEIESWDSAGKAAAVWVKVPKVDGNSNLDFIRMHWGNDTASSRSDGKAVFDSEQGYVAVWHLDGSLRDATAHANHAFDRGTTAASAQIAEGRAFDGKGGLAVPHDNSLNFTSTFTLSAWVNADTWSGGRRCILQKREGDTDNAEYSLSVAPGDSLELRLAGPGTAVSLRIPAPAAGTWHQIAAVFDDSTARLYLDGSLQAKRKTTGRFRARRDSLYLGRTQEGAFQDRFQGRMDEVALANRPAPADWIKLAYGNQKARQSLVFFRERQVDPGTCTARFSVPADTVVAEGGRLELPGVADCAAAYTWTAVAGHGQRIFDPDEKTLSLRIPRVTADTFMVFRFTARFADSSRNGEVRVGIRETIPDPIFTLPATLDWNGRDTLAVKPVLVNGTALQAGSNPPLHYDWITWDLAADTLWRDGSLLLTGAPSGGSLKVGLCLDNGGLAACRTLVVNISLTLSLGREPAVAPAAGTGTRFDALGRRRSPGPAGSFLPNPARLFTPGF